MAAGGSTGTVTRADGEPTLRGILARAGAALRAVIGAPDYARYVTHMATAHPMQPVLRRDEFEARRLEDRFSRPGARCC